MEKSKKILYLDMDEVLADFLAHPSIKTLDRNPPSMYNPGFFRNLQPVPGALEAVRALMQSGRYDVQILTQPVAESPLSYLEKAQWIWMWIPELGHKINMGQDKSLFRGDFLIDDNAAKWRDSFEATGGRFIHFRTNIPPKEMWREILEYLL